MSILLQKLKKTRESQGNLFKISGRVGKNAINLLLYIKSELDANHFFLIYSHLRLAQLYIFELENSRNNSFFFLFNFCLGKCEYNLLH